MRVLIVDDSRAIRQLASMALEGVAGWQVATAETGELAVQLANRESPDAILLDVTMPGMDGPATLSALQAGARTRDIPVIFVTAHDTPSEHAELTRLGATGIIQKPFEISRLAEQVSGILGRAA